MASKSERNSRPESFQMVPLPDAHFSIRSLNAFERTQVIGEVYIPEGDGLRLISRPSRDDRTLARKRQKAADILGGSYITFGALHAGQVAGFLMLNPRLQDGRMVVESFTSPAPSAAAVWVDGCLPARCGKPGRQARKRCIFPPPTPGKRWIFTAPWAACLPTPSCPRMPGKTPTTCGCAAR